MNIRLLSAFAVVSIGFAAYLLMTNTSEPPKQRADKTSANKATMWGYEFVKVFQTGKSSLYRYQTATERIEATISRKIDRDTANTSISERISLFRSMFERIRPSYAGQHTRYISCSDRYKPRYFEKTVGQDTLKYFIAFANSRYVTGVCSEDSIAYTSMSGFLYCDAVNSLVEINYFIPVSQEQEIDVLADRISCELDRIDDIL